jgi:2-oxoisovalerate dehydrogenase E1 component alpha subunit
VKLGHWSEDRQSTLEEEMKSTVTEAWKEAITYGSLTEPPFLDVSLMFEDVFAEMPDHLLKQRDKLLRMNGGKA